MSQDHEQTVRLLEKALEDARACRAVAIELVLYDQDGAGYIYRWIATDPPAALPSLVGHCARIQ